MFLHRDMTLVQHDDLRISHIYGKECAVDYLCSVVLGEREIFVIQKYLKAPRVTLAIHVPHLIHLNHNVGPNALFPLDCPSNPHGFLDLLQSTLCLWSDCFQRMKVAIQLIQGLVPRCRLNEWPHDWQHSGQWACLIYSLYFFEEWFRASKKWQ